MKYKGRLRGYISVITWTIGDLTGVNVMQLTDAEPSHRIAVVHEDTYPIERDFNLQRRFPVLVENPLPDPVSVPATNSGKTSRGT